MQRVSTHPIESVLGFESSSLDTIFSFSAFFTSLLKENNFQLTL